MTARAPHPQTIFHLVPTGSNAEAVLGHPDNEQFVSQSKDGGPGLEIGYHVAARLCPEKLVAIGRAGDLVLRGAFMSAWHFSFEVHPESKKIMFRDRSSHGTTITTPVKMREHRVLRQMAMILGFSVVWPDGSDVSKQVEEGYEQAMHRLQDPHWALTVDETATDLVIYYNTRPRKPEGGGVRNFELYGRLSGGGFGTVHKAIDRDSGRYFAAKVLEPSQKNPEGLIWHEVKTLSRLKHMNIVEYPGSDGWGTSSIHIFMPLRQGSVNDLFTIEPELKECRQALSPLLQQMLEALDFMSYRGIIHRDVKPDNILYTRRDDRYLFRLADFGLSCLAQGASSVAGTDIFMAPEIHRNEPQIPKMDVWSLFVSILLLTEDVAYERRLRNYTAVLQMVKKGITNHPELARMGEENVTSRASAGQLLIDLFDGKGLTTPRAKVLAMANSNEDKDKDKDKVQHVARPRPEMTTACHKIKTTAAQTEGRAKKQKIGQLKGLDVVRRIRCEMSRVPPVGYLEF